MDLRRLIGFTGLAAMLTLCSAGACVVTIDPPPNDDDGGNGGGGTSRITIRLVNTTNTTLDPEFYIAAEPVSVDQLFDASRKFTSFGVGTIGLLADRDSAEFTLECSATRVLGSKGGRFGNNLNSPDGVSQQVVLTQDVNVFCGDTVTLTFGRSGSTFTTSLSVTR